MTKTGLVAASFLLLALAMPASAETYKYAYPNACADMWPAVKDTLANQENYAKVKIDDAKMNADYQPKHSVHVDITGTLLQRMNHVTLITQGTGCEMRVVSNYSGWGHEDQGDFKKRVDEALAKPKAAPPAPPAQPAKPEPTAK
ncbi:MAG TPA: hypothetical protein VN776_06850 [Terracidiphilus sp.]|nr:hypothetical protein [Terracidiphilus sp.]